jgi:hypothetical protein
MHRDSFLVYVKSIISKHRLFFSLLFRKRKYQANTVLRGENREGRENGSF